MQSLFRKIFLNDNVILAFIIINAVIIFLIESGYNYSILLFLDIFCTLFFIIEMIVKIKTYTFKTYWTEKWNRFDFIIVFISIPSLLTFFIDHDLSSISTILALRLLRIFRVFRIFHMYFNFFPNINSIGNGLKKALAQSRAIIIGFIIIILIFGLINCGLFKNIVPEYFGTPGKSIFTVFRIFTIEGWYEIPNAISAATSPLIGRISRLYFSLLLCGGGIIGVSFINSVFVDAMAEDNNDDVKEQLRRMEKQLEDIQKELKARNDKS